MFNIILDVLKRTAFQPQPKWPYIPEMEQILESGDIVCRLGNAYSFGFIPISNLIAYLTDSLYSHAAVVLKDNNEIVLADVASDGVKRQYLRDWMQSCMGSSILVLRYKGDQRKIESAVDAVYDFIDKNAEYDFSFNDPNKLYCTELPIQAYKEAGVEICQPIPAKDLPNWSYLFEFIASVGHIDINTPIYCVGNKDLGILSSKVLEVVKEFKLNEYT